MLFGDVVSLYLKEKGISQAELARATGLNKQTISAIIVGDSASPTLNNAVLIADALGVPIDEMVDRMREDA